MNTVVTIRKQVHLEEWAEMVSACRSSEFDVRRWCMENGSGRNIEIRLPAHINHDILS